MMPSKNIHGKEGSESGSGFPSSGQVVEIVQLGSEKSFLKGMPVEVVTFPGGIDRVAPIMKGDWRRFPEPSIPRQ